MCGIFGIFAKQPFQEKHRLVRQAIYQMSHRGPDESGFYEDDLISLAVCRLSIVDVKGGHQPHINPEETVSLICNGEIYNHRELRYMLEKKGHQFQTGSDTEVILHLYEEKGMALLDDLAGMFAFALWDREKEILFLARDRVGIKPLYIYSDHDGFAFSSEMTTLVKAFNLSAHLLSEKIWAFLSYGFPVDNRQTVHKDIRRLMPGEGLIVSREAETFFNYWSPSYMDKGINPVDFSLEEVEKHYTHSIADHFVSEVPSAVMLSGGLDSTSIVSFADDAGFKLPAVTIGYDGNFPGDERELAREAATLFNINIREVLLTYDDYIGAFNELMHHCDEPVADIAAIPQWKIFEQARQSGFKVLQNGLGGDELFYGYGVWNQASDLFIKNGYHPFFPVDDVSGFFFHPAYRASRDFLNQCATSSFKNEGLTCDTDLLQRFDGHLLEGVDRIYHLLFKTWLPNNCLLLADRLSMAHSIELRVPMLDNRLVDYVQSLPQEKRFYGEKGKYILKRLLKGRLPDRIINRPKQGFTPPGTYMKAMISSARDEIFDSDLVNALFLRDEIEKLWACDAYLEIWFRLLVFAKWRQNTFGQTGAFL